jgi:hypothetical protein
VVDGKEMAGGQSADLPSVVIQGQTSRVRPEHLRAEEKGLGVQVEVSLVIHTLDANGLLASLPSSRRKQNSYFRLPPFAFRPTPCKTSPSKSSSSSSELEWRSLPSGLNSKLSPSPIRIAPSSEDSSSGSGMSAGMLEICFRI